MVLHYRNDTYFSIFNVLVYNWGRRDVTTQKERSGNKNSDFIVKS